MAIMYIRLEGPMQGYSDNGRWEDRDTVPVTTKSAIMGMIGAAFGFEYGSKKIAELCQSVKMAVRENKRATVITDFQTIRAYRMPDWDGMVAPIVRELKDIRKADGKPDIKVKPKVKYDRWVASNPKLRDKEYLNNGSFTVFLEGEQDLLQSICDALANPVYALYLGRSSCIPSRPILGFMTDFSSIDEAIKNCDLERVASRCMVEQDYDGSDASGAEVLTRNDNVGENYRYYGRKVIRREVSINVFE